MNWNTITIEQYQAVAKIIQAKDLDDTDKEINIAAIVSGKTVADIEAMNIGEWRQLQQQVKFIYNEVPEYKPRFSWKAYRFIYDVNKINVGRFITAKYFQTDLVGNLHHLAASVCKPLLRRYNPEKHEKYAQDLKQAPFAALYSSMVFFCHNFQVLSLKVAQEAAKTSPEAKEIYTHLKNALDGLPMSKDLQNIIDARLMKP